MPTVVDAEIEFLKAQTGLSGSLQDLEFAYYSSLSTLSPVAQFSVTDHQRRYWETQTGLTNRSMADLEKAFYDLKAIPAGSLSDREYVYYASNVPPTFVSRSFISSGVTTINILYSGMTFPVKTNDMVVLFVGHKPDADLVPTPAGWTFVGSGLVGTGLAGIDTGRLNVLAFYQVLTTDNPADILVSVPGGNVALATTLVFRKYSNTIWTPPTSTVGDEPTSDVNFTATGANLNAKSGNIVAAFSVGTANTAIGGRSLTVPGCTGSRVGVNSNGTPTGNGLFCWTDYFPVTGGTESAGPNASATFSVAQSGGSIFVKVV